MYMRKHNKNIEKVLILKYLVIEKDRNTST